MTSLTGSEALMREKCVVTYGQPFYAGWGLTQDRHPPARRTRRRILDAAVLVDHRRAGAFHPERVALGDERADADGAGGGEGKDLTIGDRMHAVLFSLGTNDEGEERVELRFAPAEAEED